MPRIQQAVVLGAVFAASAWTGHLLFGREIAPAPAHAGPPPVGAPIGSPAAGATGGRTAPARPPLPPVPAADGPIGDTDGAGSAAPVAEAPVLLTFEDISEWELDPLDVQVPASVRRHHGRTVDIVGYMIPYGDPDRIEEFLIVGDLGSCCFGGAPKPNRLVEVRMAPGRLARYAPGPVRVRGEFRVEEHREGKFLVSIFAMTATDCVEVR